MIFPEYLHQGDRIRIVAPAGKVSKSKVIASAELLQKMGFEVVIGEHVFNQNFQFAGTDQERAFDFQEAINDPKTRAIISARGGYGSVRIIDRIDFSPLQTNPKWFAGFSDVTVLHSVFNKLGLASIHGTMPGFFISHQKPTGSFFSLIELLQSKKSQIEIEGHSLNRKGSCTGQLVGGCLSLIYSLQGTPWQLDTKGKILLIEDLSEYLYHIDRMMQNLRMSGQLKDLAGLVVGGFTDMKDSESPFGKSVYEIIFDAVKDYDFPVCFDFPVGHIHDNFSLMLGAKYDLEVAYTSSLTRIQA